MSFVYVCHVLLTVTTFINAGRLTLTELNMMADLEPNKVRLLRQCLELYMIIFGACY